MKKIFHSKPDLDAQDLESVVGILERFHVTSGLASVKFSELISSLLSRRWTVPVQSGTDALALALKILNLKENAIVAVPAYTCGAILDALAMLNLKPAPIDIDRKNLAMDILKANSTKYDAVIAAHLFGIPAPFHKIRNKNLIEDCAQCLGCETDGKRVGSLGVLSICSFFGTKIITTGHGGAVSGNNEKLHMLAMKTIRHDKVDKWIPHFHFAMSDYNAALGISQAKKIRKFIDLRRKIASEYFSALGTDARPRNGIYYRFLVVPRKGDATPLIRLFNENGIEAKKPVYKPLYKLLGLSDKKYPNAAWAHKHIVSVPIYPSMDKDEIRIVTKFLGRYKNEMCCWPPA